MIGQSKLPNAGASEEVAQTVVSPYSLAVNDYVECVVWQTSGGGLNILANGNYSPEFSMVRVG
jgi:hypothetical protein